MIIIHTADIHLGSRIKSKYPKEITSQRRQEVKETFSKLISFAKDNEIKNILLAGDVFDSNEYFYSDHRFFYSIIYKNPDLNFFYLKGNHDLAQKLKNKPDNLFLFDDLWTTYDLGENIKVTGIEITKDNVNSLYSTLSLNEKDTNIVMLHGQIIKGSKEDGYLINLKKLENKNIDYLALGHIHKPSLGKLDDRGIYVYPGCLEPRGFDETGDHGFYLYDTETKKASFVNFSKRKIIEADLDISDCKTEFDVANKIETTFPIDTINAYRINLIGDVDLETSFDVEQIQKSVDSDHFYFLNLVALFHKKCDAEKYKNDKSLKGEFIRTILSEKRLDTIDRDSIINYALKALSGEEID